MKFILLLNITFLSILYVSNSQEVENTSKELWKREMRMEPEDLFKFIDTASIDIRKLNDQSINKNSNQIQNEDENKLISQINSYEVESEVHAAANPNDPDNMVVSPIHQYSYGGGTTIDCPVYYTFNGGMSWNRSNFKSKIFDYPNAYILGGGDPVLEFTEDGTLYFTWLYFFTSENQDSIYSAIFWSYSTDGGRNWNKPVNNTLNFYKTHYNKYNSNFREFEVGDKQWMASNSEGDVFTSYTLIRAEGQRENANIYFTRKLKNENKFQNRVKVNSRDFKFAHFSTITSDSKQNIHLSYLGLGFDNTPRLYHSKSTNNGQSFTNSNLITEINMPKSILNQFGSTDTIVGITSRRLYPAPNLKADNSPTSEFKDNLYLVWNSIGIEKNLGQGMEIFFSRSTDGGETWSKPAILNRDDKAKKVSQFYPGIDVNEDGVIAVTYYDRRNDPEYDLMTGYYIQFSFDGGKSFTEAKNVSSVESSFQDIGRLNNSFGIGEYNKLLLFKDHAYAVWADGRAGNGNVRIYGAKVDLDSQNIETIRPIASDNYVSKAYIDGEYLNVEFNLDVVSDVSFLIYDNIGKKHFETNFEEHNTGPHSIEIPISNLSTGVYHIMMTTEFDFNTMKFIVD